MIYVMCYAEFTYVQCKERKIQQQFIYWVCSVYVCTDPKLILRRFAISLTECAQLFISRFTVKKIIYVSLLVVVVVFSLHIHQSQPGCHTICQCTVQHVPISSNTWFERNWRKRVRITIIPLSRPSLSYNINYCIWNEIVSNWELVFCVCARGE